jgi:aminomethyltransferase
MSTDLKRTSLYERHLALKAKMSPFAGFEMPVQYSSVKDEVIAVRQKSGLFDVSHMGEFFVRGSDAVRFVDEMITNDFANAPVGKAVYSPLCRQDGTVIDDLIAYKLADDYVLICVNASNIQKDWNWLQTHALNYDCDLVDRSSEFSLLALQGPDSVAMMKAAGFQIDDGLDYYGVSIQEPCIIARTGYTGEDGFEIFGPHNQILSLWDRFIDLGVTPAGLAARDVLRLEVCYPLYGHELNDTITPLDASLKWTVKSAKPNFMGKEALSTYKPLKKLVKLSLEKGIPRDHYPVLNSQGTQIGEVTSGTMSVTTGMGIAMALIDVDNYPQDEQFYIQIRSNTYPARLHKKAFHTGGHK